MSENEKLDEAMRLLGMASFMGQCLEYSLVSLFAVAHAGERGGWPIRVREIMNTRYSQTLGGLVRDAATKLDLPVALCDQLEDALIKRNWVTHHFFREFGAMAFSQTRTSEAISRLKSVWPILERVSDKVHDIVVQRFAQQGRTEEQIEQGIEKALQDYLDN